MQGWIRAVPLTTKDDMFLFSGVDVAFQRSLQTKEPRCFVAVARGTTVRFFRLNAAGLASDCSSPISVVAGFFVEVDGQCRCRGLRGVP